MWPWRKRRILWNGVWRPSSLISEGREGSRRGGKKRDVSGRACLQTGCYDWQLQGQLVTDLIGQQHRLEQWCEKKLSTLMPHLSYTHTQTYTHAHTSRLSLLCSVLLIHGPSPNLSASSLLLSLFFFFFLLLVCFPLPLDSFLLLSFLFCLWLSLSSSCKVYLYSLRHSADTFILSLLLGVTS